MTTNIGDIHESSLECADSISDDSQGIYTENSSSDEITETAETAFFAGKAALKITLLVKTPLHEPIAVARSG